MSTDCPTRLPFEWETVASPTQTDTRVSEYSPQQLSPINIETWAPGYDLTKSVASPILNHIRSRNLR